MKYLTNALRDMEGIKVYANSNKVKISYDGSRYDIRNIFSILYSFSYPTDYYNDLRDRKIEIVKI